MGEQFARGFEGLSSYFTDVDGAIAEADRIASRAQTTATKRGSTPVTASTEPVHQDGGAVGSGLKKLGGWVLAIGLVFVLKALFFGGIHALSNSGSSSTYSSDETPSYTDSSADYGGVTDDAADAGTAADAGDYNMTMTDDAANLDAASDMSSSESTPQVTVENDDATAMGKPAPGYATLTMPELRYCLAEDIRLSGQKAEMEAQQIADTDKFNRNVDGFNEAVSDYNNSCSNRSIISSQESRATSQVEGQRFALEAEGRSRVD
jgi:hypothetical protein